MTNGSSHWIGDGFCDDINNNEDCNYDGGDCCGKFVQKHFCLKCQCMSKDCIYGDFLTNPRKDFTNI